ncbi:MAG TPA: 3'(2'),5'-bisphosphate nucleotidase CysQ [Edaphocola sp.]|nr:3'(2'),5'-bisphosphate nucleotidase CysQ [Edaphocola sp.]
MDNLLLAIKAALKAGEKILTVYERDFNVETKADQSPLTEADQQSNEVILTFLEESGIPVISEEIKNMDYAQRAHWQRCWLVDPLDGTKEFIKRNGEFTVNIALIENGKPVLGVVYIPVQRKLFFAAEGQGSFVYAFRENEDMPDMPSLLQRAQKLDHLALPDVYTVVASRSHLSPETEAFIRKCKEKHRELALVSMGSSLKLCLVAERKAHVYPRLAPTMEWDTAAAHAVAKFAGCSVLDFDTREELHYNKENLLNPHFIVLREEQLGV